LAAADHLTGPTMEHLDDIATDFTFIDLQFFGHVIILLSGRLSGSHRTGSAMQAGDGCG
jgi:methyl coenzyme M reductase alpha subunit